MVEAEVFAEEDSPLKSNYLCDGVVDDSDAVELGRMICC
jgi:hypothetical protein